MALEEFTGFSLVLPVDLQCCIGRRSSINLWIERGYDEEMTDARERHSGDPWHWKNSQSALRQVVGSLVPEIAPGNQFFVCIHM